jgi:hypothetical protein
VTLADPARVAGAACAGVTDVIAIAAPTAMTATTAVALPASLTPSLLSRILFIESTALRGCR